MSKFGCKNVQMFALLAVRRRDRNQCSPPECEPGSVRRSCDPSARPARGNRSHVEQSRVTSLPAPLRSVPRSVRGKRHSLHRGCERDHVEQSLPDTA